ncbi:MAG: ribosome maturation factor RimM [Candidatus Velthaea sp.]
MTRPNNLNAGRIVGTFGLRGECKIDASRIGADTLARGLVVRAELADGTQRELCIRTIRLHKGRPLASFDGFDDATAAQALTGAALSVERAEVALREGEYLDADLLDCVLIDGTGREYGRVVAVEHYPAQDMLLVGERRSLVPLVSEFVKGIDLAAKSILVELPPGLVDDREAEQA